MIFKKDLLVDFDKVSERKFELGDGNKREIEGKCTIAVYTSRGKKYYMMCTLLLKVKGYYMMGYYIGLKK